MEKPSSKLRNTFRTNYNDLSVFASNARLLQSIWRHENNIPHRMDYFGNFIEGDYAYKDQHNFHTAKVKNIVAEELRLNKARTGKEKKVIRAKRLHENLLSSQPLAFNLFAELIEDNFETVTNVFQKILPNTIKKITAIEFEISPGRSDLKYTGDKSAFDVFIKYQGLIGNGFIGIEIKYAETLKDIPASFKTRYKEVAELSGKFTSEGIDALCTMPVSKEQIWRDHLLSLSMLPPINNDYAEGTFIYLFPKYNEQCVNALMAYSEYVKPLSDHSHGNGVNVWKEKLSKSGLFVLELEDFLININEVANTPEWSKTIFNRYLDFGKIDKYNL